MKQEERRFLKLRWSVGFARCGACGTCSNHEPRSNDARGRADLQLPLARQPTYSPGYYIAVERPGRDTRRYYPRCRCAGAGPSVMPQDRASARGAAARLPIRSDAVGLTQEAPVVVPARLVADARHDRDVVWAARSFWWAQVTSVSRGWAEVSTRVAAAAAVVAVVAVVTVAVAVAATVLMAWAAASPLYMSHSPSYGKGRVVD